MNLEKIISISGKPGLYRIIGQMKNGVIVESLIDGKHMPAFATQPISALEDITVYGVKDDVALKDVFQMIFDKENGEKCSCDTKDGAALSTYIEGVFPEYDKERVHNSAIKKIINWYNLLLDSGLLKPKKKAKKAGAKATDEAADTKDTEAKSDD